MSELENYDSEIYELDERIGRLALICGADLSQSQTVAALIKGRFEVCLHSGNVSKARHAELRGLLMLKYKIEASCIDTLGIDHCAQLIKKQDAQLRKRGFPPQSIADTNDA